MLPGTRSDEPHTHTQRERERVFFQTHTYNKLSLYSWLPIVFTVANTFRRQHLNLSLSAGLGLSASLCVTWQGANLGPYLCLQLCSHSLLHKHLICHHCQSEQIRLPTAESARPPSSSSPPPTRPPYVYVTNTRTVLPHPSSPYTPQPAAFLTHTQVHTRTIIRIINTSIFCAISPRHGDHKHPNPFPFCRSLISMFDH